MRKKSYLPEYRCWASMIQRCTNQKRHDYKNYGGRGLSVCNRWLTFENFYADMGERPQNFTLERIDNDQGYSPGNCKWASRLEQTANRRNMIYHEFGGLRFTLSGWAKHLGITSASMYKRFNQGKTGEDLFSPRLRPYTWTKKTKQ